MQGSTVTIDYSISSGGVAVDLTTWSNLRGSCSGGGLSFDFDVIDIDHENGVGQLRLSAVNSASVPAPAALDWDFFGTDPDSKEICLSRGKLHFTTKVTSA